MNIKSFITEWIRLSNAFDTDKYLEKYHTDAILDDPSVGRKFIGHSGIRNYFTSYFIGYKTHTRLIKLDIDGNKAHLEVEFTGEFPEGKIGGLFDITFKDEKIAAVKADLI
ncbi:MAG TPA: nuclear transport factor 2 family protein [Pedobacter sp.]|nr:nuclear transport factor 2 family protein [Pedobacter sp.]